MTASFFRTAIQLFRCLLKQRSPLSGRIITMFPVSPAIPHVLSAHPDRRHGDKLPRALHLSARNGAEVYPAQAVPGQQRVCPLCCGADNRGRGHQGPHTIRKPRSVIPHPVRFCGAERFIRNVRSRRTWPGRAASRFRSGISARTRNPPRLRPDPPHTD